MMYFVHTYPLFLPKMFCWKLLNQELYTKYNDTSIFWMKNNVSYNKYGTCMHMCISMLVFFCTCAKNHLQKFVFKTAFATCSNFIRTPQFRLLGISYKMSHDLLATVQNSVGFISLLISKTVQCVNPPKRKRTYRGNKYSVKCMSCKDEPVKSARTR